MLEVRLRDAGARLAYLMIPKSRDAADFEAAVHAVDRAPRRLAREMPLHALVETHGALREVAALAAHPRLESLSFGLMDFVSAHRGAIPQSAMGAEGQFTHPLVVRAKLEIAAACHGHAKTPSHCVVTEFKDSRVLQRAAERACREFGYTRMWSIHPDQVRVIVDAFAPTAAEVDVAVEIIDAAAGRRLGADPHRQRRPPARPRELPLLLARDERAHRTGAPCRPSSSDAFSPRLAAAPARRRGCVTHIPQRR